MSNRRFQIFGILRSVLPDELIDRSIGWNVDLKPEELMPIGRPNTDDYEELLVFALAFWLSMLPQVEIDARHQYATAGSGSKELMPSLPILDRSHWSKLTTWSIPEATILSLGIIPTQNILKSFGNAARNGWGYPIVEKYSNREKEIMNAIEAGTLTSIISTYDLSLCKPYSRAMVDWFEDLKFDFCEELTVLVRSRHQPPGKSNVDQRAVASMQKMIIGMAIEKYGHKPFSKRSFATKKIQTDLELQGIELDDQTIRDKLKAAEAYINTE